MKRIVLVTFSMLLLVCASAQKSADVGIWGGAATYFGDMTKIDFQSSLRPAYGLYLRYNFNPRVSARAGYIRGDIFATGEYESRGMSFEKRLNDYHVLGEFNFFKYIMGNYKYPITTYLLGGLGASSYEYLYSPGNLQLLGIELDPNMPNTDTRENLMGLHSTLGFGFKFNIGKRWGVGAEVQLRKYFNDKLDNLDDPRKSVRNVVDPISGISTEVVTTYTDTWHNNDWTVNAGVHITYRFYLGKKDCPVYENLN